MIVKDLEAYQSKFLNGEDVGSMPKNFKIVGIELEKLGDKPEKQLLVGFVDQDKKLVCNKTQYNKLTNLFGFDTDNWLGKVVMMLGRELTSGQFKGRWTIDILGEPEPPKDGEEVPF